MLAGKYKNSTWSARQSESTKQLVVFLQSTVLHFLLVYFRKLSKVVLMIIDQSAQQYEVEAIL